MIIRLLIPAGVHLRRISRLGGRRIPTLAGCRTQTENLFVVDTEEVRYACSPYREKVQWVHFGFGLRYPDKPL